MGGGTPVAEHSSSRGLFTAMVTSSGELELVIFGGSAVERCYHYCWLAAVFVWENTGLCVITKHGEVEGFRAASSLITGHAAIEASV